MIVLYEMSLSGCKLILFGHILMFFHFVGHPILLETLQVFRHEISQTKPLQIAS